VSEEWRESLQFGVRNANITVRTLASLVEHAPQAAVDLLDALTEAPELGSREHYPLPIRANIPLKQESCRIACAYEKDEKWHWSPTEHGRPWHKDLAPRDTKLGQEVKVKVVKLKGIMDVELIHNLAVSSDCRIFTKLAIHGLLKFAWSQFRLMFILTFIHEVFTAMVISIWVWGNPSIQHDSGGFLRRAQWSIVATHGLVETISFVGICLNCCGKLGLDGLLHWGAGIRHRALIGVVTLALAVDTYPSYGPHSKSGPLLAIGSLLHWVTLLYQLRAFQWTGRRLLPILRSVLPISGMLAIMLFVGLGFTHAFLALNHDVVDQILFMEIVTFLFTGEHWLSRESLKQLANEELWVTLMLSVFGVFIFLTCTLNVFIAVLGDCYDQEQERMVCTYLKERAKICTGFFLWPEVTYMRQFDNQYQRRLAWITLVTLSIALNLGLLGLSTFKWAELSGWVPAFSQAICWMLLQGTLRGVITEDWERRYLWICHEASIEEGMFLASGERDVVEQHGRISQLKRYIYDQNRVVGKYISQMGDKFRTCREGLQAQISVQNERMDRLTSEFEGLRVASPPPEAMPLPTFGGTRPELMVMALMQREISAVRCSVDELRLQMNHQGEEQARLTRTVEDIASALHKILDASYRRRARYTAALPSPESAEVAPSETRDLD